MAAPVPPVVVPAEPTPAPVATKRKAGSDLTEPADKKSKTVHLTPEPDLPKSAQAGGVINLIANRFSSPFLIADSQFVIIDTADIGWDTLLSAIYPDGNFVAANVITRADFILVCRYLTKARIDHVYATVSGRRARARIPIPREFEIPKCLADVINGIGAITISAGAFLVIPQAEAPPADAALALGTVVTHAMLTLFSRLVKAATARNLIRSTYISSVPEGTAWWLLSARVPANIAAIANNADSNAIVGTFKEWTPADGIICALVQRQNDGLFPALLTGITWSRDTIRGISGLRNTFNLDA